MTQVTQVTHLRKCVMRRCRPAVTRESHLPIRVMRRDAADASFCDDTLLADAAVVISVALQHGIPAQSLAKSIGRLPAGQVTPADLDEGKPARIPASPIGAALDLLRSFEDAPE